MTKAHILIQSVALGILLIISSPAKANGPVDQVLVQYFKKLYGGAAPKCPVDLALQTKILSEIEPKCLIRDESKSFIAGIKPTCTEEAIRNSVNAQVDAHCGSTAFKLDQEKQVALQKQQAAEQEKQKAAAAKQAATGENPNSPTNALAQVAKGLQLYSKAMPKISKVQAEKEAKAAKEVAAKEAAAKEAAAKPTTASTPTQASKPTTPAPPTASAPQSQPALTKEQQAEAAKAETDLEVAKKEYDVCMNEATEVGSGDTCSGPKMQIDDAQQRLQSAAPKGLPTKEETLTQADDIAKKQRGELEKPSKETVDGKAPEGEDPELKARHEKSRAEDTTLNTHIQTIETKIKTATGRMPAEANSICSNPSVVANPDCIKTQPVITCLDTNMAEIQKLKTKLQKDKESCSNSAAQAEKLCSLVRSDKAKNVQKLMSVGATILSKVTAASEACGTTSDISKIAQGGMLLAQGSCTAMKFRCDFSCNSAKKTLLAMEKTTKALKACQAGSLTTAPSSGPQVDLGITEFETKLKEELGEQKSVPVAIKQCQNHKADIALMGLSALGFGSAFLDAENCKKQLAAGETNNANGTSTSSLAGAQMTTAEYCSAPANATSLTCKCTNNPGADGCMGSMAKSGVNIGKINSGNGPSAFASANQNGLGSVDSIGKSPSISDELAPGANLSDAAREALGIGNAAAGSDIGGAGGSVGSNADATKKTKEKKEEEEKSKYGFFSNIGNMMSGGRAPSAAANAAIRKFEQEQAIKRKLASDQVRAEVTAASGKSNFDKIRSRYQQNAASFEQ